MSNPLKIIISGGPCSGKTTLIQLLESSGYSCIAESARIVIREQLDAGTDLVPWLNLQGYSDLVFDHICTEAEKPLTATSFFDRSSVDVVAYLTHGGIAVSEEITRRTKAIGYHPVMFFAPFWADIYQTDAERKESPEEAQQLSQTLYAAYQSFGFTIITLPLIAPRERLQFILQWLKENS
ncbi:MAG: AAA family ATPase [Bacteroidota bacterium]